MANYFNINTKTGQVFILQHLSIKGNTTGYLRSYRKPTNQPHVRKQIVVNKY